jgi:CRP-like cAMP-binding protein
MRAFKNRLLRALSASDLDLLKPRLKPVELKRGRILEKAGGKITVVYFLESGIASVVARSPRRDVGFAVLGLDGMTGLGVVLGSNLAADETLVQSECDAHCIPAGSLRTAMTKSRTLHRLLLRYVHVFLLQASQTALMNAHGDMEQRLARWILMSHDRFERRDLSVTHDFIALMLGVRRASITDALHVLEGNGQIRSTKGRIHVLSRPGLITLAGQSYGVCESAYDRLIGPERRSLLTA